MTSNIYGSILDTYTERDYKKEIETNPSITDKEIAKMGCNAFLTGEI